VNGVLTRHGAGGRRQLSKFVQQLMESNNRLLLAAVAHPRARPMDGIQCGAEPL